MQSCQCYNIAVPGVSDWKPVVHCEANNVDTRNTAEGQTAKSEVLRGAAYQQPPPLM